MPTLLIAPRATRVWRRRRMGPRGVRLDASSPSGPPTAPSAARTHTGPEERLGRGPHGRVRWAGRQLRGIAWIGWLRAAAGATRKRPHQPQLQFGPPAAALHSQRGTRACVAWFLFFSLLAPVSKGSAAAASPGRAAKATTCGSAVRGTHPLARSHRGGPGPRAPGAAATVPHVIFIARVLLVLSHPHPTVAAAGRLVADWWPRPAGAPPAQRT